MREIPMQNGRRVERGQAILEFAMIVPMLFLMLVGVAYFAMGFNLQQVLNGAAHEGARVWARNPAGGSPSECSLPKCVASNCDPNGAGGLPKCTPEDANKNNFVKYIVPVVRNYVTSHGFDGKKVKFYIYDPQAPGKYPDQDGLSDDELNALSKRINPESVIITILYPYNLPIGNFAEKYTEVSVSATCTLKKG